MLLVPVWILVHNQSLRTVSFAFSVLLRYSGPVNNNELIKSMYGWIRKKYLSEETL